ncbi:MAG: T9SS type A sorting domain-containing protein [Bacteroidales bacterium]|nr:T9SS type A sorting domain-containing protein [Bacteroidales bacterium]
MTGTGSATNGTYTLTSNWDCPNPNSGQVNIAENVNYIISTGVTVNINGNLRISGHLKIEDGASLNVSGSIIMDCYTGKSVLETNGSLSAGSISYASNKYPNNVSIQLSNSTNIAGDVELQTSSVLTIPSGVRIHIPGDLTNNGTINCNGRLVVGTLDEDVPDGKTIIESNGTITNLGTININTTDEALAKTDDEPILENSVYYAAITCGNLVNGKNQTSSDIGTINMYDGSLIVQDNAQLWYKSKILFKKGQSYIDVWGNLVQLDKTYEVKGEEAVIKLDGTGAKAQINVRETYEDWTTLSDERETHDWDLDNDQFTIDPNVKLSVGKYYTGKTEYLDEDTYSQNSWYSMQARTSITRDFYATEYSYVGDEINDYQAEITILNEEKEALTPDYGSTYLEFVGIHGEDVAREMVLTRIAEIDAEIASKQAIITSLERIQNFDDDITASKLEELNNWFFDTDYGQWFASQNLYIRVKKGKNSYEYKSYMDYFYRDWRYNGNNHLKLYHYILAYMDEYGNDALYYEGRHNALSVMLPIELSYFEVAQDGNQILFDWATESENNNDYFTVEYSLDGVNFNSVVVVDGAGNSTEQLVYNTTISAEKYEGIVYFRLKQTDFDGQSTYSEARVLYVQGADDGIVIYPNPATTTITIDGGEFSNVYFVDMQSKNYSAIELGGNQYSVENLSTGIYYAVISTANGKALKKFIVTKSPVEK